MTVELERHPLFEGVAPDAVALLVAAARMVDCARGDMLALPGALRNELLLVLDGFLYSYELTDDGGRVLFEVVGPGGFDGAVGVLGGVAHFTEAASAARVASVAQADVDRAMERDSRLASNLMRALVGRISRREHQLTAAALKDPSKQIAKQLLAIAEPLREGRGDTARLPMRMTHQQIADMLGIRRETVTLHLHQLARTGAVVAEPTGMRVSRARLQAILDDRLPVPRVQRAG